MLGGLFVMKILYISKGYRRLALHTKMNLPRIVAVLIGLFCAYANAVSIRTSVGQIVGVEKRRGNDTIREFHGIPYAEPPIGDRRFKPPVPKEPFKTPFSATKLGSPCIQNALGLHFFPSRGVNTNMSEDCLSLNVYSPLYRGEKKAVMVWIYGGAFLTGTADSYDASKMAAIGDVIVVTLNYRTGIVGFFSTGDANARGNYGLLDQQLALKWVKNNIIFFGGDPDRVTIFGESAGASSATWHMLSPSNEGLFHRVIAQSGVAPCPWSFPNPGTTAKYTATYINAVGCSDMDSKKVVECLRKIPASDLGHNMTWEWPYTTSEGEDPAGPRVDNSFIPISPNCRTPGWRMEDQPMFKSVDILLGSNRYEAEPVFAYFNILWKQATKKSLYEGVPYAAFKKVAMTFGGIETEADVTTLWMRYSRNKLQMPDVRDLVEFFGDSSYYKDIANFVNRHASSSNRSTYMYSFLPKPSRAAGGAGSSGIPMSPFVNQSMHTDELPYLFGKVTWKENENTLAPGEKDLSDAMIIYWTNFAKTGNPNKPVPVQHEWPTYTTTKKSFIEFDIRNSSLNLRTNTDYRGQWLAYWTDIKPRLQGLCPPVVTGASTFSKSCELMTSLAVAASIVIRLMQ